MSIQRQTVDICQHGVVGSSAIPHIQKACSDSGEKNTFLLTGSNLQQNPAMYARPSAEADWGFRYLLCMHNYSKDSSGSDVREQKCIKCNTTCFIFKALFTLRLLYSSFLNHIISSTSYYLKICHLLEKQLGKEQATNQAHVP